MEKSFIYNKEKLQEWRSSACMIPVLLELIKEKFLDINQNNINLSSHFEIDAYQAIYEGWKKTRGLNSKQREWVDEIGDYLNAIEEIVVHSQTRETSLTLLQ